jgi:aminoglycoside N3'-acetyltransferase
MGLSRGDIVEVHGSLRSFGHVEGGAATVVDALMAVVGEEGTLVSSAYLWSKPLPLSEEDRARGILCKVHLIGENDSGPTGMGAITDELRSRPNTAVGSGMYRVCAWGNEARLYAHRGYDYLLQRDGHALLLGVDIHSLSSMHLAQRVGIPPEVSARFRVPDHIRRHYPEHVCVRYGARIEDAWGQVKEIADRRGLVKKTRIGQAECMLFRARAVVSLYEHALRTDPYSLFGVQKQPNL